MPLLSASIWHAKFVATFFVQAVAYIAWLEEFEAFCMPALKSRISKI
jgi:hypothetical protein